LEFKDVLAYYSKPQVRDEITAYCSGRWIALEGIQRGGGRAFLRYTRKGVPLTISKPEDIDVLLNRFRFFKPRTFYASVNLYEKLENQDDTGKSSNIVSSTPIWDVDADIETWEYAIKASEIIVDRLEKEGISSSVYLKWSGRGIHIHIHEGAFSKRMLEKYNPLDVSFSIVEYILKKTKSQLIELAEKTPLKGERPLRVENKMDIKRVFTAPLSLHRQLDLCCVCFKPNAICDFSPEWAEIERFRHDPSWRDYEDGEGDDLAKRALAEIGGYDGWAEAPRRKHTYISAEKRVAETLTSSYRKLGRFQVMGLLQAARYYLIKGDLERAKSFGLNRAIFYAWAKRYARDRLTRGGSRLGAGRERPSEVEAEQIGNETAYLSNNGWFIIGGTEQSPRDYDLQIARRIEAASIPYSEAWKAAIKYLEGFSRDVLLDQQRFYREAYLPVRDKFHMVIDRMSKMGRQRTLDGY